MRGALFLLSLFIPAILGFNGWDDYHEKWKEVHDHPDRLFPYGDDFFDSTAGSNGADANIQFSIPFAGRLFSSVHIAEFANMEFSTTSPATHTDRKALDDLPDPEHPNDFDPPMIAAWHSSVRLSTSGTLFWRTLDPDEDPDESHRNITEGLLIHIGEKIRRLFLDDPEVNLTAGVIATWEDKNTFQIALVTDGHETFSVLNYYKLEWMGSVFEKCAPMGVPTESNDCVAAQVGFNFGDALGFYQLPFSRNKNRILSLSSISGDDSVQGRYVYRVSNEKIQRGGCTNDTNVDNDDWPLEIWPKHGSFLGGYDLYFTGPCITKDNVDQYWCQFGTNEDEFHVQVAEGEDMPVGKCVVPRLDTLGEVVFRVYRRDEEGDIDQAFHDIFISTHPDERRPQKDYKVHLNNEFGEWSQAEPETLSFTWNPNDMYDRKHQNQTTQSLQLSLLWSEIHELEASYPNHLGHFEFNVDDHQCAGGVECEWGNPPPVGFVVVMPQNHEEDRKRLLSHPTPVSWYVRDHLRSKYGPEWTEPYCEEIFEVHPEPKDWFEELSPCPATASQARAEIGRFIVGPICNETEPCPRSSTPQPHVVHECFNDITPKHGRARCCYDNLGDIVDAMDEEISSTSDFASPLGSLPYDEPGNLPLLSHWIWDIIYRMACCNWVADSKYCIDHYNTNRPTPKIQDYHPPGIGAAYGDPHYRTFDGLEYLFNGRGEFWILRVNNFHSDDDMAIQARFQQPPPEEWGEVNATVISGVVFQEGYANSMVNPRVEFHLNFDDASTPNALLVSINGVLQDFSHEDLRIQEFKDAENKRRLLIKDDSPRNDQSNFTITFQNGVAAQDKTDGLLGDWDGDQSNDLRTSNGNVINPDKGPQEIHEAFGMSWEISSDQSRFTYHALLNWEYYRNPDFVPSFDEPSAPYWPPEGSEITEEDVNKACGSEFVCRFDFKTTMNQEVGMQSLSTHNWTQQIAKMATSIHTCGRPEVEHSIYEYDNYLVAGSVEFTGCDSGYTLRGTRNFRCETSEGDPVEASWQPSITNVQCKSNSEIKDEEAKLATAIAVPICLIAVIAGVTVGGFFYMRNKKKKAEGTGSTGGETGSKPKHPPVGPLDDLNNSMASSGSVDLKSRPTTFAGPPQNNPVYGSRTSVNSQASITGAGDLGVAASDSNSFGRATPVPYAPISMNPAQDYSQRGQRASQVSFAPENQSGRTSPVSYLPLATGPPTYDNQAMNLNPAYEDSANDLHVSQTSLHSQVLYNGATNGLHGSRQSLHSHHSTPDTEI
ncbi:hypothetical protein CAPTEDRAFT_222579 [Capitella teleta]|uniref:Sushi domain-containing protein n=1 Tax=Capitella teleta TaxID=283909 RepID=R7VCI7_CAPTE|nr:hypothetical protein CAPTEDRAFT_222579 [Capitella teleta]|eukprot:ELU14026.1 hypothetical protein CAPTEDRAFT_222579 [Capitella teleta]